MVDAMEDSLAALKSSGAPCKAELLTAALGRPMGGGGGGGMQVLLGRPRREEGCNSATG